MEVTLNTNILTNAKSYYNGIANTPAFAEKNTAPDNGSSTKIKLSEDITNLEELQNFFFALIGMASPGADPEKGKGAKINLIG